MRSSRKLFKMPGESWKLRCQQICLAKIGRRKYSKTSSTSDTRKTKCACICEADESARKRSEGTLHKDHEDHIAGKGINSLSHDNLVQKFIPMPQTMKIPEAKAAVEKEWEHWRKYQHHS